jgi:molybdopterin converting factor small subunit
LKTVKVKVLYFGPAKDIAGAGEEWFSLSGPNSVNVLLSEAERRHPELTGLRKAIRIAVNEEMASGRVGLHDGDVVAVLPPVVGG